MPNTPPPILPLAEALQSFTPQTMRRAPQRVYKLGGRPRAEFVRWCTQYQCITRDMISEAYQVSPARASIIVQTARHFGLLENCSHTPGVKSYYRLPAAYARKQA